MANLMTKHVRLKLIIAGISGLVCLAAMLSGCTGAAFSAPPTIPTTQFRQVDLYQLQLDYYQNPAAADASYSGKRYYFGLLQAEHVTSIFDVHGFENYVMVGNVKFKPNASADIRGIIQGTLFEVSGDIQGVQDGYIVVTGCQFTIRSGGSSFPTGGAY